MIRTRGLTKDFTTKHETVHAVRGITLDVEPGELVAVLGPNGAGKTTTLRMLTTLIAPTAGTAQVAGHDTVDAPDAVRRAIGYVGQGNAAGHAQLARDELVTQGIIYGQPRREAHRRADELLDALELTDLARRKVSDLSGGQRRRLDVAMGLVHSPSLLFLDEPSTGLDPHNRANLWEHITRMRTDRPGADPMTIVLTTHYLDEADTMAERVVVVDHGEVIADDTAEHLKASLAGDRVIVRVPAHEVARFAELAANTPGSRAVHASPDAVELRSADGPAVVPGLLRAADADGITVAAVQVHRPTLDDVFLALTGRSLRETSIHETATTKEAAA